MKLQKISLLTCCLSASAWLPAQAATLLLNGSFESPVVPTDSVSYTVPTDWSGNSSVALINGNYGSPVLPQPEDGDQYLVIGNNGIAAEAWQSFTAATTDTYTLNWYDSSGYEGILGQASPYTVSIRDSVGGIVISQNFDAIALSQQTWVSKSLEFDLVGGDYTVVFSSLVSPGGYASLIDNVTLVGAAVPEPAATALVLGLAAGGVALARRQRQAKPRPQP
ncbi:MAG: PEP-CTERM sorting domain-containing protein [Verrucomicrobiae bacterium]|nr:PEP-CTERM sorting domain-containing protein [Verrucomicrobiae bacterium]